MKAWNTITSAALLGSSRAMPSLELPAPFGELLEGAEAEAKLLRACGILGVAGAAAKIRPVSTEPVPAGLAEEEADRLGPPEVGALARRFIEEGRIPLIAEMGELLARSSLCLPARLLPAALELGRKNAVLRETLRKVLGRRGAWLAAQNPDWAFALLAGRESADRRLWEEGDAAQRAAYLRRQRAENSAEGRALLESVFGQETARDRAVLLPALGENLSAEDEAFLAKVTSEDRSKEVRQIGAMLLSRLPDSELARGITESLAASVRSERKLFRNVTILEPPAAFDPRWKAYALEEKPPAHLKLGERGWWLLQLVSLAPLGWWEKKLECPPAEVFALVAKSDWKDALLAGFRLAVANQPGFPAWTLALLEAGGGTLEDALALALKLPPAEADRAFQRLLAGTNEINSGVRIVEMADFPWSADLWRSVRQKFPQWLRQQDWRLRATLAQTAYRVPVGSLDEELKWPDEPFFAEAIAEFSQIIDHRKTLHQRLRP